MGFDESPASTANGGRRRLLPGRLLGLQVLLLPLYGFWALVGAASSPSSPAWGFFVFMGIMWIAVTSLLAVWSWQGREGLVARAVAWGLLAWLNVFLLFLLP